MASNTALYTGLTGLNAHSRSLDVIGNNIANVNTTAFKSSRALFSNVFSRTLSAGAPPLNEYGGTNPYQIGLGVNVSGTQRDFGIGSINDTGRPADLAIDGEGFFLVQRGADDLYTRAGAFQIDRSNRLVTIEGDRLRGFGVDPQFNLVPGTITDLTIPIGQLTLAEATTTFAFTGNLNAGGDLPSRGSLIRLGGTEAAGLGLIGGATVPPGAGNLLETASLLAEIEDPSLPGSGTPLFSAGQWIEVNGAQKGTRTLPASRFEVGAASTVQQFMDFLRDALGLNTTTGPNPDLASPGVALNPVTGRISVTGNTGSVNDLTLDADDIDLLAADGTHIRAPFASEKLAAADGESVRTQLVAFDSLGAPFVVDVAAVLSAKTAEGTTWRYYVESGDDSDLSSVVATGELRFDTSGRLLTTADVPITVDLAGSGALTPQTIAMSFGDATGGVSALADGPSEVFGAGDGSPFGTLIGFNVDRDGFVIGSFDNGEQRLLGQVALAAFINPQGLVDEGDNLFRVGANSGPATVTTPGLDGSGRLVGGALEFSNVDLGREFINMILASTGYTASSRVISTTDEMLQNLVALFR